MALGGGRVVDVAKALAAASAARSVAMAIPTTLSGAEMTRVHRQGARRAARARANVRPRGGGQRPGLSASQPRAELAASALNALGHAAEGPCTPRANPVVDAGGARGGAAARALAERDGPDRDGLALGALLAGYTIDSTGYGLHHVLSQTLVRLGGVGHGPANAMMLPTRSARSPGASRTGSSGSARRWAATRPRSPRAVRRHGRDAAA